MDIIEYAEKICGAKLTDVQKRQLKLYEALPKGSVIVMGRKGPLILDSDGKKVDLEGIV